MELNIFATNFSSKMVSFTTWLLAAKVFALVVFPLGALLPIWVVTSPSEAAEVAIAFFMLLPHVMYPILWAVGSLFGVFDADEWFKYTEVLLVGVFSGFILPVIILIPIYYNVAMTQAAADTLLGYMIALLGVWMPLLVGSFYSGAIQDAIKLGGLDMHNMRASPDAEHRSKTSDRIERRSDVLALFFFFSVPLAFFLPLYIGVDHSDEGEATMIFFMLLSNLVAFHWQLSPRLAVLAFSKLGLDTGMHNRRSTMDEAEAIVKLVYSCSVLPMIILLPLYLHGDIRYDPKQTLAFYLLALPPVHVLEVIRTAHRHRRGGLPVKIGVAYFGLVMPLGIMLPTWLAGEPDSTGKSLLLGFMMTPTTICLLVSVIFTAIYEARLPFLPLDAVIRNSSFGVDISYTFILLLLPVALLLPVYFSADLEDTPNLIILCFIGILFGTTALLFAASWWRKNDHGVVQDTAIDLPYAATESRRSQMALEAYGGNDALTSKGDQFIASKFKAQAWAAGTDQSQAKKGSEYVNISEDDATVKYGWQPGMRVKAPHDSDDRLYEATIVSIDTKQGTARVNYIGYDDDETTTVAIADVFESDDHIGNLSGIVETPLSPTDTNRSTMEI